MSKGLEALKRMGEQVLYSEYAEYPKVKGLADYETVKKELKALEIIKKAFDSSSIYTHKLKDSLECGWITEEEYDLLKEVLL